MKNVLFAFVVLASSAGSLALQSNVAYAHPGAFCRQVYLDYNSAGDVTNRLYQGILGRYPEPEGYQNWVNNLMADPSCNGLSRILQSFGREQEVYMRLQQLGAGRMGQELARAFGYPNPRELTGYIQQGNTGYAAFIAASYYLGGN